MPEIPDILKALSNGELVGKIHTAERLRDTADLPPNVQGWMCEELAAADRACIARYDEVIDKVLEDLGVIVPQGDK